MKAIVVKERGGSEVLNLQEIAVPQPGAREVLVKVAVAGVNFADIMQHMGTYPLQFPTPYIPGMEVAGIVAAVGDDVSHISVGNRVAAISFKAGGYAEYIVLPAEQLILLPEDVDLHSVLAILIQGLSAYFLLDYSARLQSGESVLVHAAAGGVGNIAIQIAKIVGAGQIFGTVGSEAKRTQIYKIGADYSINYTNENWSEVVLKETHNCGVDVILDSVGASTIVSNLRCLGTEGRLVTYGWLSGDYISITPEQSKTLLFNNQSIIGFAVNVVIEKYPKRVHQALHQLLTWLREGKLKPILGQTFSLNKASAAHTAILNRETSGKVILTVDTK